MKKISVIAAAVASTLMAGSAFAAEVDFHGYMRAGFGINGDGGSQLCYGNGGPTIFGHAVGRLGDECDNYAELAFNVNKVWEGKDGSSFNIHTLVAYGTHEASFDDKYSTDYRGNSFQSIGTDPDSPWKGERASFREAWVDYTMANGMRLWGGERYYGRKDLHIMDFYYVNNSGVGLGLENIDLGFAQLQAAVVQHKWKNPLVKNPEFDPANPPELGNPFDPGETNPYDPVEKTQAYSTANTIDLRLTGIQTNDKGNLELIAMVAKPSHTDAQKAQKNNPDENNYSDYGLDKTGMFLTAEHTQGFSMGFNKAVIQYATEGYAWAGFIGNHAGDAYNMETGQEGRKSLRLIDWGVLEAEKWNLGYALVYAQLLDDGNGSSKGKAMSAVVRPGYKWSETMSTIVEVGHFQDEYPWREKQDLTKFTIAQQWQAGDSFWARPAIRVFASKYTGDLALDQNDLMFGAQVEAWW
ncbi:maltoporin [Vibrio sp. SM6]|uniref:Maltoporin n=1 Tax=Vibrio agarilyticus TaxID=2726741 RepID=A0A7X8TT23_9VIBR|nr:carbohydrate porin [Vibrio agarilyticus]NLS14301.1 maltoporin [Vibrio agarilyticus]